MWAIPRSTALRMALRSRFSTRCSGVSCPWTGRRCGMVNPEPAIPEVGMNIECRIRAQERGDPRLSEREVVVQPARLCRADTQHAAGGVGHHLQAAAHPAVLARVVQRIATAIRDRHERAIDEHRHRHVTGHLEQVAEGGTRVAGARDLGCEGIEQDVPHPGDRPAHRALRDAEQPGDQSLGQVVPECEQRHAQDGRDRDGVATPPARQPPQAASDAGEQRTVLDSRQEECMVIHRGASGDLA